MGSKGVCHAAVGTEKSSCVIYGKPENDDEIIVEDLSGNGSPHKIKAENLEYVSDMSQKSLVAEEQSYKAISPEKEPERLDITIGKTYMEDEKRIWQNASQFQ